jgi:hypothetical protein
MPMCSHPRVMGRDCIDIVDRDVRETFRKTERDRQKKWVKVGETSVRRSAREKSRSFSRGAKRKRKRRACGMKTHAGPTVSRVPSLGSGEPIEKTVARRRLARPPLSCSGVTHHRGIGVLIV